MGLTNGNHGQPLFFNSKLTPTRPIRLCLIKKNLMLSIIHSLIPWMDGTGMDDPGIGCEREMEKPSAATNCTIPSSCERRLVHMNTPRINLTQTEWGYKTKFYHRPTVVILADLSGLSVPLTGHYANTTLGSITTIGLATLHSIHRFCVCLIEV